MDFRKYLDKSAGQLDREVDEILQQQINKAKVIDQKLAPLLNAFAKSCQGGKRIRGALVKLGYELAVVFPFGGPRKSEDILKIGAAYEILHTAILIHDDIIDQSLVRRGKPSLYQALGGNHYGVSQAISLADYGFFLAFKIIADTNAAEVFSQIVMDTAFGQMLELKKANPLLVMKLKTARYTIAGPLKMGAILAGASPKLVRELGEFGENLGIAFQIKDDILDSEVDWLGGINNAKKAAEKYKNKALEILSRITKDKKMSKLLEQMAKYLIEREK